MKIFQAPSPEASQTPPPDLKSLAPFPTLSTFGKRLPTWLMLVLLSLLISRPQIGLASSTIFGGGPFYTGGTAGMNALRASGFTTVMLWCIHVDATSGNLIFNDQLVVTNGVYVGNAAWPGQLATLKTAPTSVNRIEVSVSSYGVNDFQSIQTLMNNYGTNTTSILYRNFAALKTATGADAIDYDDETLYDITTAVKFGRMLATIGYKVTLCPYTSSSFWQGVYNQLGSGIVDAVYLQCYAGGAGNNPATWNGYFSGLKVQPGMWCKNGGGCTAGNTSGEVLSQMTSWRSSAGIPGGFMWLYDDMLNCTAGGTPADYARAINQAVDSLQVSPGTGFSAVAAFNALALPGSAPFGLTNSGASSLNWSVINTSSWLTVSASSGALLANGATSLNVNLNSAVATNLALGNYSATILFSNVTTKVAQPRTFTLNTAVANWPVAVTGFNAALLAPDNATAATPKASAFDIPNNYCFYQAGLNGSTRGLPATGVFASLNDTGTAFQLGSFGATNALLLGYTYPKSGTLVFSAPQSYNSLAILASSANGGGLGTFVLTFTNGTQSPVFTFNAQDWFYNTANVAVQGFGRLKLGASLTIEDNGAANPNLYQTTVNLAALGLTLPISSITFSNRSGAGAQETTAIFAISGMPGSIPVQPPTGLVAIPGTNATVNLSWNFSSGATNYNVKRSILSGSAYATVGAPTGTNFTDTGLANGSTYFYVVSAVGPIGESTNSAQVSAAPGSYRSWAFGLNPVAYWPLNETNGNTALEYVRGSNGFSAGTFTLGLGGAVGAGFGSPHRATHYDGVTAYTQLPLMIGSTSFSIVFWVQTATAGGTPNWYNGKGMVDGEVGGAVNDFGISLVGAKVGFGIGNPDTTLTSIKSINNNLWHQVVATWDISSGAMKLFIDGAFDSGTTGPTGARTAPPSLRIGSLQTGGNYLLGNISDVTMYDQALSSNQVATLYSAATGLFYDITLTNSWSGGNLVLNWPGNGKLLEATNLAGPWTTNNSTAPVVLAPSAPQKFYRIRVQ